MTFLYWLIGAMATYRLTVLIVRDAGPWQIFKKLRSIDRCSKLLKCTYCTGIWAGFVIALAFYLGGVNEPLVLWPCISLSFSAFSVICDRTWTADYSTDSK